MFNIFFYFVDAGKIKCKRFSVKKDFTIRDFIFKNNLSNVIPHFDEKDYKIGVFGKIKSPDYIIKENDRLELYEQTAIDPKIRRKKIAINK